MDFLQAISECLFGEKDRSITLASNDHPVADPLMKQKADAIVRGLLRSSCPGDAVYRGFENGRIHCCGWRSLLAEEFLNSLISAFKKGVSMGAALQEAYDRAVGEAWEWSKEHPVWATIIAIGVLVIIAPWVLEALGFGELGPIEGLSFYQSLI